MHADQRLDGRARAQRLALHQESGHYLHGWTLAFLCLQTRCLPHQKSEAAALLQFEVTLEHTLLELIPLFLLVSLPHSRSKSQVLRFVKPKARTSF